MLQLVDVDDRPVLVCERPAVRGFEPDGKDELCPHCGRSVLLENVVSGERIVVVREPILNDKRAVMVGQPAVIRRCRETGTPLMSPDAARRPQLILDARAVQTVVDRARRLFAEILPDLEKTDLASANSANRHRLVQLISLLEKNCSDLKAAADLDVIRKAFKHARDQLWEGAEQGAPGILLIGAAFWSADLPMIVEEARMVLERENPNRRHRDERLSSRRR